MRVNRIIQPAVLSLFCGNAFAQSTTETQLLNRIRELEQRLAAVEARLAASSAAPPAPSVPATAPSAAAQQARSARGDSQSLPGFESGTTVNFLLDGYYEYNFNRPIGRVNLLRPFDQTSSNFTLNQAAVIIERAADPSQGRRFGMRLDLMFGQTTETLGGNPANEPRPAPYRNIYQAYGTYVFPVGKGLTVDFGRFASPLGFESTFAKDQINYTRSLLFTALPFYHTGFRSAYKVSDSTTASWMLTNGINQMEDFNGFKSNHFMLSTSLATNVNWTASYYLGQESRDSDGLSPTPNGRTHIADTYLTWNATPRLTLVGEGDYIVSRQFSNFAPVHLAGGAGYLKYQLVPALSLAGRYEYVSDRGGFLSGATQALKEATLTATFQPKDGVQVRWEFRHDYSNQQFFLTRQPGLLKKQQTTALMGLLWWFGGKSGSW